MRYKIFIEADIESNLTKEVLENKLVISLFDTETNYSKTDGIDDELSVSDYSKTEAIEVCDECGNYLKTKMFDIDGTHLVELWHCSDCNKTYPCEN